MKDSDRKRINAFELWAHRRLLRITCFCCYAHTRYRRYGENNWYRLKAIGVITIENNRYRTKAIGIITIENNRYRSKTIGIVAIENNRYRSKTIGIDRKQ